MKQDFTRAVSGAAVLIIGIYLLAAFVGTMPASDEVRSDTVDVEIDGVGASNATVVGPVNGSVAEAYGNETVEGPGGTTLDEGTDYEYYPSNNTLVPLEGGSLSAGDTVTVTLWYHPLPPSAAGALDTFGSAFTLAAVAVLVVFAALILNYVGAFGNSRAARR